jgi:PD-(D/E)XK nuclease superfamily
VDDESEILPGGRFDLVIESQTDPKFAAVVESKVGSGFGKNQLLVYRKELSDPDSFPGIEVDRRFLITLTTLGETAHLTDANLKWSDVQHILALGRAG